MAKFSRNSLVLTLAAQLAVSGSAFGQDSQPVAWEPVDQTVADLDLRATSLRHVEQGISVYGQSGTLYRRTDTDSNWLTAGAPLSQQYMMRRPGFTAYIDQPDYLVIDQTGELSLNHAPSADGHYLSLIPPNTVFDLSYPTDQTARYNYDLWPRPNQVIGDASTRYDGRVTGDPSIVEPLPEPPIAHRLPQHLIDARAERRAKKHNESDENKAESAPERTDASEAKNPDPTDP